MCPLRRPGKTMLSDSARARVRRRLAAILVAGFNRLIPGAEEDRFTVQSGLLNEVFEPLIDEFRGHIFKRADEGILVEFESVVEAARCAAALRDAMLEKNQTLSNEDRVVARMGINLGDVIAEEGDIFGDGAQGARRGGPPAQDLRDAAARGAHGRAPSQRLILVTSIGTIDLSVLN